jgi:hypothetical protein
MLPGVSFWDMCVCAHAWCILGCKLYIYFRVVWKILHLTDYLFDVAMRMCIVHVIGSFSMVGVEWHSDIKIVLTCPRK